MNRDSLRDSAAVLLPLAAMVIAVAAGINALDAAPVGVFYDDAHYVILGRSIALGEGYRSLNLPGTPAATHYPPGYPLLLALLWKIAPVFPDNVALFKLVNALLLGVVALGSYAFARAIAGVSRGVSFVVAIISTAAVPILLLSSSVMSETLFLAVLLPFLILAERWSASRDFRHAVILGFLVGALAMVRTHAVILIPAVALASLSRRNHRATAVFAATAMTVLLPWLLWVGSQDPRVPAPVAGQYGSYGAWLAAGIREGGAGFVWSTLRINAATVHEVIARSFALDSHPIAEVIAVAAVAGLVIAGCARLAAEARVTVTFIVMYLAITMLWPFSPLRFVWGIWPLLVLAAASAARANAARQDAVSMDAPPADVTRRLHTPARRRVSPLLVTAIRRAAVVVAVAGMLLFNVRGYANSWWASIARSYTPRITAQLLWVAENTRRDDVVASSDEGAVYLYTARRSVPVSSFTPQQYIEPRPIRAEAEALAAIVERFDPDLVLGWSIPTQNAAMILSRSSPARPRPLLVVADSFPGGRVFRRGSEQ